MCIIFQNNTQSKKRNYMKLLTLLTLCTLQINASLLDITSFEADFKQTITDEKNKELKYKGHVIASKPQYATWQYTNPIEKYVYINQYQATIVEPEIEQVIVRRITNEFDFFQMIKTAKKLQENAYVTMYNNTKYTIEVNDRLIKSIIYLDQFENNVKIEFSDQKQNHKIDKSRFTPKYSTDFDLIND